MGISGRNEQGLHAGGASSICSGAWGCAQVLSRFSHLHSVQATHLSPPPRVRALPTVQDVWLTAADGTKLHAWLLTPRGWSKQQLKERPVLMFFQENAGNMSHRLPFLRGLARMLQVSIFAPRYNSNGGGGGVVCSRECWQHVTHAAFL